MTTHRERISPRDLAMFDCRDCSGNTLTMDEYYMVRNEIWGEFGVPRGMLCIGCLERRMGRRLAPADFTDCPLNKDPVWSLKSARLAARLGL